MSSQNGQKKNITCPRMIKQKHKKPNFIKDMNRLRIDVITILAEYTKLFISL